MTKERDSIVCRRCLPISRGSAGDCKHVQELIRGTVEWCAMTVLDFKKHYPKKVFKEPPAGQHGKTVDGCSARAIRDVLPAVAEKLRESVRG